MSFLDPDTREAWAATAKAKCLVGNHTYSRAMDQPRPRRCTNCHAAEPPAPIVAELPKPNQPTKPAESAHAMTREDIESLREWLASWGDGPNWADPSGATVPITKTALKRLLDAASDTAK